MDFTRTISNIITSQHYMDYNVVIGSSGLIHDCVMTQSHRFEHIIYNKKGKNKTKKPTMMYSHNVKYCLKTADKWWVVHCINAFFSLTHIKQVVCNVP